PLAREVRVMIYRTLIIVSSMLAACGVPGQNGAEPQNTQSSQPEAPGSDPSFALAPLNPGETLIYGNDFVKKPTDFTYNTTTLALIKCGGLLMASNKKGSPSLAVKGQLALPAQYSVRVVVDLNDFCMGYAALLAAADAYVVFD